MSDHRLRSAIRCLQRGLGARGGLSDEELLNRFVHDRDEAAFEVLVWRHGGLVWNVCRRLLPCEADAEDAFQATFLVLVRKARTIGRGAALPGWLYKVAYRIARDARARASRQARHETPAVVEPAGAAETDPAWRDLRPVLDAEVNDLPEKYRRAFILCYLEGKTNAEAAAELGCAPGTIFSRLAWARERLRNRLTRRGVTLSAGALTLVLAEQSARATVPTAVVASTLRAAAALTAGRSVAGLVSAQALAWMKGATHAMLLGRLKIAALVVLTAGLAGVPWLTRGVRRAADDGPPAEVISPLVAPDSLPVWEPLTAKVEENGRELYSSRSLRRPGNGGETVIADTVVSGASERPLTFVWTADDVAFAAALPGARTQLWNTFGSVRQGKGPVALSDAANARPDAPVNAVTFATLWGLALSSGRHDVLAAYGLVEPKPQAVFPAARWLSAGHGTARTDAPLFAKLMDGGEQGTPLVTFTSTVSADGPGRLRYRYRVENASAEVVKFRWAGHAATLAPGQTFEHTAAGKRLTEEVADRAAFTLGTGQRHTITAHYWKQPSSSFSERNEP